MLNIVGKGPELNEVRNIAKGNKRIKIHGFLSWKDLQVIYSKCDFFVLPTLLHETFSLVILESFRFGLPVIGSNVGAVPELVKHDYNGFLFEPNDVNELKCAMEKVINLNKKELEKMKRNAMRSAAKYDNKMIMDDLIKTYEEAIAKNRRL